MNRARKIAWALFSSGRALRLIETQCAPAIEHIAILKPLTIDQVLDVGSNVGQFSTVLRALFPKARLQLFEPLPDALQKLRRIFDNDPLTTIFPTALSIRDGIQDLHISRRADSSSLLPIGMRQEREHKGTKEVGTTSVRVSRLDSITKPNDVCTNSLIKIDVQGTELDVLQGAGRLLERFRWVYCEVSFVELYQGQVLADQLVKYLFERGFALSAVSNVSYGRSREPIQADFLFCRR
jgi:FkbM family methyltransferase